MKKKAYILGLLLLIVVTACGGKQSGKEQDSSPQVNRAFEMVTVPAMISEPEKRIEYATLHYWDKFDFTDTAYVHLPDVTEQAFSNYIAIVSRAEPATAFASIKGMLKKAEAEPVVYAYFTDLYEKYLYDPNSPIRNEELYIAVLEEMLQSPRVDEVHRIRPAHLLELALKNRVGGKATDFTYTMADGQTGKMSQFKSDYLILFFYNPDCVACKELTGQLSNSLLIRKMLQENRLKILAVYPDEDLEMWKANRNHIPEDWTTGYDATVTLKNDEVYDLKAIPCLYLLDKNKKVILKDTSFNQVMDYLSRLIQ